MSENYEGNQADRLLDIVTSCLEKRKVKFGRYPSGPAVLFICHTQSAIHTCVISARENRSLLRCVLYVACRVPPEKRAAAAELFTRINYGLPLGTFETDFSDGEICYRTGIDVTGGDLAPEMVASLIAVTVGTVDRYHPAIMSFLWNDMAPEDAVAMIEGSPRSRAAIAGRQIARLILHVAGPRCLCFIHLSRSHAAESSVLSARNLPFPGRRSQCIRSAHGPCKRGTI